METQTIAIQKLKYWFSQVLTIEEMVVMSARAMLIEKIIIIVTIVAFEANTGIYVSKKNWPQLNMIYDFDTIFLNT